MRRSWIIAFTVAVLAGGWILSGQFDWSALSGDEPPPQSAEAAAPAEESEPERPRVRVDLIEARPFTERMILQGRTLADRAVTLRAETSGVVDEVLVRRGARVREGALMALLSVEERDAMLAEALARLREREIEFEAAESLYQRGHRAETQLAQAEAELNAARAAVRLAELELDNVRIRAPFAGIVVDHYVEVGDFVDIGDPIAEVMDLDPLRIVVQVAERYLGRVRPGDPGWAELVDGRRVEGEIGFVGPAASESTRTFPVELEIPNPEGRVIQGLTAEVHLPLEEVQAHYVSPMVLTLADDGEIGVKAVGDDGRVAFLPVHIIAGDSDGVWLGGLEGSVSVIVVGQEFVMPGEAVDAVPVDAAAAQAGL